MKRRFKISVDGREYDVSVVEISEDAQNLYSDPRIVVPEPAPADAHVPTSAPSPRFEVGPGDVVCPIAGVVVSVDVAVGAEVTEGVPLVTLEAMKTKTIVSAGRSGKVATISIVAGDPVEPSQVLLTIV